MADLPELAPELTRLTFNSLIGEYDQLELAIQNLAFLNFADALAKPGLYVGSSIEHEGERYQLYWEFSELTRTCSVMFLPVDRSRSERVQIRDNVVEVGAVRHIVVDCLKKNSRRIEAALKRMKDVFRANYRVLEKSFLEQYRADYQSLFHGIEPILHCAFDENHRPELKNECRLTITQLKDSQYSMYVGPLQLAYFIEAFKKSDEVGSSALALAITLIVGKSNDTFLSRSILKEDEFAVLSFGELAEENKNLEMLAAENILSNGYKLAVIEVCRVSGVSIQANMAAMFSDAARGPILASRKALTEQFAFNLQHSLAKRRDLALAWYRNPKKSKLNSRFCERYGGQDCLECYPGHDKTKMIGGCFEADEAARG
jgi:hypothetical protein